MAFNFNWSPLTADANFYTRAQDLLTAALNKSPKPPIIVDDIIVTELNLGSIPPELEILEIGDLAEDRFRGIFKMCYSGDAYLTLKTRVQINPLNTYLSTRSAFASPQPLAAAQGLTIPLQITLSEIRLSAFIILVFSKQKGITLVFRNDPLESLKVSSTFDTIPFVRDYLQRTIDAQLRVLFMDELPAIIHRLSLRLLVPEYRDRDEEDLASTEQAAQEAAVDPLASPPQDPVDATGNVLDAAEIASLSLDSGLETQSLFSQKNLIRLATLTDSQRTLSLFTPGMRDTVFRAWAGANEREGPGISSPTATPALSRAQSHTGSVSTYQDNNSSRPPIASYGSGVGLNSMATGRHSKAGAKKRKRRVINLRKKPEGDNLEVLSEDAESVTVSDTTSAASVFTPPVAAETQSEATLPSYTSEPITSGKLPAREEGTTLRGETARPKFRRTPIPDQLFDPSSSTQAAAAPVPPFINVEKVDSFVPSSSRPTMPNLSSFLESGNGSSILEQAWMMKMAGEVARRMHEEKALGIDASSESWREQSPPPVYRQ